MPRPQGEDGKFLSDSEIQQREGDQRRAGAVASVAKKLRSQPSEEYDFSPEETQFNIDEQLDPAELPSSSPNGTGKEAAKAAPKTDAPKKHTPSLIRRAKEVGFSDGEIESYDSEVLEELVWRLKDRKTQPVEMPAKTPEKASPENSELDDLDLGEIEAELDKGFATALKAGVRKLVEAALAKDKRIVAIEAELKQVGHYLDRRENESLTEKADRTFGSLGAEWKQIVGEGAISDVSDQQLKVRNAILKEAGQMAKDKGGSPVQHIKAAAQSLYGMFVSSKAPDAERPAPKAKAKAVEPLDLDEDVSFATDEDGENWFNGGLHRPTQRKSGSIPKGQTRATKAVAERMREMGQRPEPDGSEYDGLPD